MNPSVFANFPEILPKPKRREYAHLNVTFAEHQYLGQIDIEGTDLQIGASKMEVLAGSDGIAELVLRIPLQFTSIKVLKR